MRHAVDDDRKWLKASAKLAGEEIPTDDFINAHLSQYQEVIILEDRHSMFKNTMGPVGFIAAATNGYIYEPHVEWFSWATPRNKLRCAVAFFQKFRYRKLGVVRVHCLRESANFFTRLKEYVPLYFAGKIPGGDKWGRGDDHIYFMKCRGAHEFHL